MALLDRRIQVLRSALDDNGYQVAPGDYVSIGTLWAAKGFPRDANDREVLEADQTAVSFVVRFVVGYSALAASIRHTDRVFCEGVTYGVMAVKEVGHRAGFEIYASEVRA